MKLNVVEVLVGVSAASAAAGWAVKRHMCTMVSCQQHLSVRQRASAHNNIAYGLPHASVLQGKLSRAEVDAAKADVQVLSSRLEDAQQQVIAQMKGQVELRTCNCSV